MLKLCKNHVHAGCQSSALLWMCLHPGDCHAPHQENKYLLGLNCSGQTGPWMAIQSHLLVCNHDVVLVLRMSCRLSIFDCFQENHRESTCICWANCQFSQPAFKSGCVVLGSGSIRHCKIKIQRFTTLQWNQHDERQWVMCGSEGFGLRTRYGALCCYHG